MQIYPVQVPRDLPVAAGLQIEAEVWYAPMGTVKGGDLGSHRHALAVSLGTYQARHAISPLIAGQIVVEQGWRVLVGDPVAGSSTLVIARYVYEDVADAHQHLADLDRAATDQALT